MQKERTTQVALLDLKHYMGCFQTGKLSSQGSCP